MDLLGRSLFDYVHVQDHKELKGALEPVMPCSESDGMEDSGIGERHTGIGPGNWRVVMKGDYRDGWLAGFIG